MTTTDPVRRTKRHLQGERSREDILDAASALMSAKGYVGTSMSDLVKLSGLPASSIYWHFESKAGVLGAVMERGASRFFEAGAAFTPPPGPDPREKLLALLRHSDATVREHPEFLRLFMLLLLGSEGESQREVVERVRAEAQVRLHRALLMCYAVWGEEVAAAVAEHLSALALVLFDGVFIAHQAESAAPHDRLVEQMVDSIHALATGIRRPAN